jgi:hypothetical protein
MYQQLCKQVCVSLCSDAEFPCVTASETSETSFQAA